ncbi:MAG: polysaccharide biosynthesis protein [Clostridia bacterium]|nr:polysaccharide biosynthesis protein [Clostridia bacterium]
MAKRNTTARGFAILSATGFVCKLLSLIYVPIQTAVVHDPGNTVINMGFQIYVFMFSLSNAGLPSSISKMVSEQDALGDYRGSKKIFRIATAVLLALGVCFSLILLFSARSLARFVGSPESGLMLLTLSPVFIFTCINCAIRGYFQGKKNMVPTAVSQLIEQFLNSALTVTFVSIFYFGTQNKGLKLQNAAAGSALGTFSGAVGATIFLVYIYYLTKKKWEREERLLPYRGPELSNRYILGQIAKYSIPAIIGAVASNAASLIDVALGVNRMKAGGMAASFYNAVYSQYTTIYGRIISLVTFVASALMVALIPAISSACALGDKKSLRHTITSSYRALFIFVIPCLAGFTVLAHPIVAFIFFNERKLGFNFLAMWSWSNLLLTVITVQSGIMIGLGRPISVPVNLIIGMVAKFFLNYILIPIPALNMHGAAIGSATGWFVTMVLDEYIIIKASGVRISYVRLLFKPLCVSAVMGVAATLVFKLVNSVFNALLHVQKAYGLLATGSTALWKQISSGESHLLIVSNDISLLVAIAAAVPIYFTLLILWGGLGAEDILRVPGGRKAYAVMIKAPFLKKRLMRKG